MTVGVLEVQEEARDEDAGDPASAREFLLCEGRVVRARGERREGRDARVDELDDVACSLEGRTVDLRAGVHQEGLERKKRRARRTARTVNARWSALRTRRMLWRSGERRSMDAWQGN